MGVGNKLEARERPLELDVAAVLDATEFSSPVFIVVSSSFPSPPSFTDNHARDVRRSPIF